MPNNIRTIKNKSEFQLKVKGSLFIASANPVKNEDETSTLINSQKKIHYDASHHCYGYKFADGLFKYSDAGEPSGTAGIRIMNAINHFDLSNVIVIVTRYFGGTKLGVGPLGKAYYESALECLDTAYILEQKLFEEILIGHDFEYSNYVYRIIEKFNIRINQTSFEKFPIINCLIPVENKSFLLDELTNHQIQKINVNFSGKTYYL